ncbi:MAG TPA: hypothetical protein VG890_01770, partial [Puia sp.]|nr:hypothetical protein [Puia sp.]
MTNLYLISGLGADKRIFGKLGFPENYRIHYIEWAPFAEGESMEQYAAKLSGQIDQREPFSLIGLSFGGMLAVEISKILEPKHTVLISSVAGPFEFSWSYRLLGKLALPRIYHTHIFLRPSPIVFRLF